MAIYEENTGAASQKSAFWLGVRDGAPFLLVVAPFGLLFGVLSTEAGLNVFETLSFSIVVIAGASQMAALSLLQDNAPTLVILVSALAVNLRMAMYSASITPHLGAAPLWKRAVVAYLMVDQSYALSITAYEKHPEWSLPRKLTYFFGVVLPCCVPWYIFTLVGSVVGSAIPDALALDFAAPITFIAMVAPMLRTLAHVAACVTAIVLALLFAWVPFNGGLLIAATCGMMAGARIEQLRERRP